MIKYALLLLPAVVGMLWLGGLLLDGSRQYWLRRRGREVMPLRLRVIRRHDFTDALFTVTLADPRGKRLPRFQAGQYVGLQQGSQRRYYSLAAWSSQPGDYQLAIRRVDGGEVSSRLQRELQPGSYVGVWAPRGSFVLDSPGRDIALIAGGIGITPLRAMLHACLRDPRHAGARIALFYAARHRPELCFHQEFMDFAARQHRFHYHPLLSRPGQDWQGLSGRLTASTLAAHLPQLDNMDFYVCAGDAFMREIRQGLLALNVPAGRIRTERFSGMTSGAADLDFTVRIDDRPPFRFGSQPSLLAAIRHAGVEIPHACGTGQCGACRLTLIEGHCSWLIQPETALADNEILACCTRPGTDLALSLSAPACP
ncbi:MAG: 2Fe-2S iron-sulfur cluster binding domain-containing protein [Methylomonas sp.]|nr:2Fe-2S iron-sulfur cluster binding domain-containing protein [Methylomonas sp.]